VIDDVAYLHAGRVHVTWIALGLLGLLGWLELRGRDALGRFVSALMQTRLARRPTVQRRMARLALVGATFGFGIVALMQPQTRGGEEIVTSGRVSADIMVVLDVSRSMLAEDAAPTRLARAKADIATMLGQLAGHRVGLVAFAGRAVVLCPLTPDYGFFRMILRGADPKSVARGGTHIGDALRKAIAAFGDGAGSRLILLITDGEDHGAYALEVAKEARAAGIRIVAIGFGSETGSEITLVDPETGAKSLLTDRDGQVVKSRLDGELLRTIALETEGAYVPAGTAALDLESIVAEHIEPIARAAQPASVRIVPEDQYPWFVLGALVCLCGAVWVGSTTGRGGMP
jgi:Ca-activated chloride channel family protein